MTRDDAQAMIDAVEARMLEKEIAHKAAMKKLYDEHERKRRKLNRAFVWFALVYGAFSVYLLIRSHS